ncbi:MAG: ABC transporter ATP-binding protein [Lachnospiraceae bacterium]|nr:ABC transporter ATP-binding protein [Lachnospiraceae bacterium]
MENNILEFEHVTGKKGKFRLKDIHFALPAGYIMALIGNNGAGKTTLINYIMQERKIYDGVIRIQGQDIRENHAYIKNIIGLVSDENPFLLDRTADQNAQILGIFYEDFDMDLFHESLKKMDLSPKKVCGKMSRGEYMKFQVAFAIAHHSKIYLLDEVTAGMDPVFRIDFFKILQDIIKDEQASVLMISHIESEVERKTDYVGILENGKMIRFGESMDVIPQLRESGEV